MKASNAKIVKILSSYHLRFDHDVVADDDNVAIKCDCGWVYNNMHSAYLKREWFDDPGYLSGLFMAKVKPCHCPECMKSNDWVHELSYLREHIVDICSKIGVVNYKWNEAKHTVAGYFVSKVYEESKPVFIQWKAASSTKGYVQAVVGMNNWDAKLGVEREPIKKRVVISPSTNSLYTCLMGIRGDMYTPISYKAEDMDSEGCERLAAECARSFAHCFIYRNPADHSYRANNRVDEQRIRNNKIWWASMYEPDDVMRSLKKGQEEYLREYSQACGNVGGIFNE